MQKLALTRIVLSTAFAVIGLVCVQPVSADIIPGALYGVNNRGGGQFLAIIDKTDASVTNIGPTGIGISGLAVFRASAIFAGDNTNYQLVTLDPDTGAVSSIIGAYGNTNEIGGMAFRPSDGVLFAADSTTREMVTINSHTGEVTSVGSFGGMIRITGLSFVGNTLLGVDFWQGGFYEIDQSTGRASLIGYGEQGSFGGPLGLATDPTDGTLFSAEWRNGADMTLATIPSLYGPHTRVGTMIGAPGIGGLSFAVPEPTTLVLLMVGCAVIVLRRR